MTFAKADGNRMTEDRLDEILAALHWSDRTLAIALDEHWATVRRWRANPALMPPNVERWLERISRAIRAQPQPKGWPNHKE